MAIASFIGEMGVVENRPRSATARAASEVEVEIFMPTEFLDHIASSPPAARVEFSVSVSAAENEVIAGGVDSPFVFSVFIA